MTDVTSEQTPKSQPISNAYLAREGSEVLYPAFDIECLRRTFANESRVSAGSTSITLLMDGVLLLTPILAPIVTLGSGNVRAALAFGLAATLGAIPTLGNIHSNARKALIASAKPEYFTSLTNLAMLTQAKALASAQESLVNDAVIKALIGRALSMDELAKLVMINDSHFDRACDRLAITVLQAKLMLGMSDGYTSPALIHTYDSLDLTSQSPDNDDILRNALETQFAESGLKSVEDALLSRRIGLMHDKIKETLNPGWQRTNLPRQSLAAKIGAGIKSFYVDGYRETFNLLTGKTPSPEDQLPAAPVSFVVPEMEDAPDLAEKIEAYNQSEHGRKYPLDLPALKCGF